MVQVPPLHELRIELEKGESCSIKLLGGTAEIFGFELSPGFENPLAEECKAAIFTWTGCDLEISVLQDAELSREWWSSRSQGGAQVQQALRQSLYHDDRLALTLAVVLSVRVAVGLTEHCWHTVTLRKT